jgi:hypothetical protein
MNKYRIELSISEDRLVRLEAFLMRLGLKHTKRLIAETKLPKSSKPMVQGCHLTGDELRVMIMELLKADPSLHVSGATLVDTFNLTGVSSNRLAGQLHTMAKEGIVYRVGYINNSRGYKLITKIL